MDGWMDGRGGERERNRNGKWEMGNGKWEMGNGKWEMDLLSMISIVMVMVMVMVMVIIDNNIDR